MNPTFRAYLVTALVMAVLGTGSLFVLEVLGIPLTQENLTTAYLVCYPVAVLAGLLSFNIKRARRS